MSPTPLLLGLLAATPALGQTVLYDVPDTPGAPFAPRTAIAALGDVDGDGHGDFARGEPWWQDGVIRVRSGLDGAEIYSVQTLGVGGFDAELGSSIVALDDVNGDGVREFAAGEPNGSLTAGSRFRVRDGATGAQVHWWTNRSALGERGTGVYIGDVGDYDGDGFADVATTSVTAGDVVHVQVFSAGNGSRLADLVLPDPAQSLLRIASFCPVGDLDGDGRDDFALGQPFAQGNGMVRIVAGGTGAVLRQWTGSAHGATSFGSTLATAGDIDGDGVPDVYVTGRVRAIAVSGADGSALFVAAGPVEPLFGGAYQEVVALPDVDRDGLGDLAVQSTSFGDHYLDQRHLRIFSSRTGTLLLELAPPAVPPGSQWSVPPVERVAALGDVNGDGLLDLAIADPVQFSGSPGTRVVSIDLDRATFCESPANSTGGAGQLVVEGAATLATNDAVLAASSLPPGATVMFIGSLDGAQVPLGAGTLCLGGSIGRYNRPGELQVADASGRASLPLDLGDLVSGAGTVAAVPGDVWRFQAWHRDVVLGIPVSNLTAGVALLVR